MNNGDLSDEKITAAHLAILFAFLLGIVSKESIPSSLNIAVISISAAIPFLALATMLSPFARILTKLERVIDTKPLRRIYFVCFGIGHILGLFSLTCIFYSLSNIAGITFIVLCLILAVIVGAIFEKMDQNINKIKSDENT